MYDEPLKFAKVGRFDIPLNDKSEPSRLHQWFAFQSAPDFFISRWGNNGDKIQYDYHEFQQWIMPDLVHKPHLLSTQ